MQYLNHKQQLKLMEDLFPKNVLHAEARNETDKIKTIEQEVVRDDLIYKIRNKTQQKTI